LFITFIIIKRKNNNNKSIIFKRFTQSNQIAINCGSLFVEDLLSNFDKEIVKNLLRDLSEKIKIQFLKFSNEIK